MYTTVKLHVMLC